METIDLLLVFVLVFFIFIFVVILSIGFFVNEKPQLSPIVTIIEEGRLEEDSNLLSYDNIRFVSREITYAFDNDCSVKRIKEVNQAFDYLSTETVLSFRRVAFDEHININCINNSVKDNQQYHLVGTGGPVSLINTSSYYIISNGSINLYGNEYCERSNYAIHEILHVLGFSHSLNPGSIMYEILSCDQKITNEIIDEIALLYRDPILPDLTIVEATIVRYGTELEIKTVVLNAGLASVEDISITLYNKNKKLIKLDIGDFGIGTAKVVFLDEIHAPKTTNEFILVVDDKDLIDEIDESNNVFTFEA